MKYSGEKILPNTKVSNVHSIPGNLAFFNSSQQLQPDNIANSVIQKGQPFIHAKCIPAATIQRKCTHCDEEKKMQRKEMNSGETIADSNVESYVTSLNGRGQSLSHDARQFYEPRFGYDFSNVKVHTDSVAAKSAQSINALAYTSGNNIVFNSGQYSPNTDNGKSLLGHELVHIVQQGESHALGASGKVVQRQLAPPATLTGVTASRVAFNNSNGGAVNGANCAARVPAALGIDGPNPGDNGMEMIFEIHGAVPAGTEFDITRTKATGTWECDAGGAWSRIGGDPAGSNDDHHDDDECLTPVANRVYVNDTPGMGSLNPRGTVFPNGDTISATATGAVRKHSFAEWVIARNRRLGIDWVAISRPHLHRWHSVVSVVLIAGVWTRVDTPSGQHNEIELGNIVTTGPTP